MVKVKFLIFTLFFLQSIQCFSADSTGIKAKLNKCYELNKRRDIALISEAKALIPIAMSYPESDLAVRVYTLVARGFMNSANFDSCGRYFDLAIKNSSSLVTADAKGKLYIGLGWCQFQKGNENEALSYTVKAYDNFKVAKDSLSMANALANMASFVETMGQFGKALEYKKKALDIYRLKNDTLGMLKSLNNIGGNFMNSDDALLAIKYLNDAVKVGKNYYKTPLFATIYANIAYCQLVLGNQNEIAKATDSIFSTIKAIGYNHEIGKAYFYKAYLLSKANKKNEAIIYADSAAKYIIADNSTHTKTNYFKLLTELYYVNNQLDKALEMSIRRDSVLNQAIDSSNAMAFARKAVDFELSNSKAEIDALKQLSTNQDKQVQTQRQVIGLVIGIVVVFLVAFLLTLYLFRKSKRAEKAIQVQSLVVANQNAELKKQNELQLMTIGIVGHDLRGPLASALTIKQIMIAMLQAGQIDECIRLANLHFDSLERIHKLSNNLVQWVLSAQSGINLNFSELYVKDLIDEVLLNFETVLKEKNIEVVLDFHPTCKVFADQSSVQTILRNIIQNAIKFTPEHKKITIMAYGSHWTPDRMYIYIQDEGKGIAPDILEKINSGKKVVTDGTKGEKGNGLGLIVIQTLLSLNKGRMIIQSEVGKGTSFQIDLPSSELN